MDFCYVSAYCIYTIISFSCSLALSLSLPLHTAFCLISMIRIELFNHPEFEWFTNFKIYLVTQIYDIPLSIFE